MKRKEKEGKKKQSGAEPESPTPEIDPEESVPAEDQRKRGYYYDDSHGYRRYVPEEDEEGLSGD